MDSTSRDQSVPKLVSELWELVVAYFKQETVRPLKGLGRFVAWGVAGGLLTAIGSAVLLVAVLRVLQTETGGTFHGNLTPLPYVATAATGLVLAGLAVAAIASGRSSRAGGR